MFSGLCSLVQTFRRHTGFPNTETTTAKMLAVAKTDITAAQVHLTQSKPQLYRRVRQSEGGA